MLCCWSLNHMLWSISKHSSDALTSHKVIKTNGNDGTTASVHGVILAVRTVWCKLWVRRWLHVWCVETFSVFLCYGVDVATACDQQIPQCHNIILLYVNIIIITINDLSMRCSELYMSSSCQNILWFRVVGLYIRVSSWCDVKCECTHMHHVSNTTYTGHNTSY